MRNLLRREGGPGRNAELFVSNLAAAMSVCRPAPWPVMLLAGWLALLVGASAARAQPAEAPAASKESAEKLVEAAGAEAPAATGEDSPTTAGGVPTAGPREYQDALELLADLRVDQSYFDRVLDGQPLLPDETEGLLRLLFASRRFSELDYHRWTKPWDEAAVQADPAAARGRLWLVEGRLTAVEPLRLIPELVDRFLFDTYYRCELTLGSGEAAQTATVYALTIPKAWKEALAQGQPIQERVSVRAFFYKFAGEGPPWHAPLLVADRVRWHDESILGDLRMDLGLFDEVLQRREFRSQERECFYQLLAACGRIGPDSLERETRGKKYSGAALLKTPHQQQGKLMAFEGRARRVTRVAIDDPAVVERLGIDHYWQVEVLVEFEALIRFEDKVLRSYPVVFCVRNLPPGMPVGDWIDQRVRVSGFFFKLWAYESELSAKDGESKRQSAPLLVGHRPVWFPPPETGENPYVAGTALAVFLAALAGMWLCGWYFMRQDTKFSRRVLRKLHEPAEGESLHDFDPPVDPEPDFRHLQ